MNLLLLLFALLAGCQTLTPPSTTPPGVELEKRRFQRLAGGEVVGQLGRLQLRDGDTLADIARYFGVVFQAIQDANPGIDPWLPPPGSEIILPLAHILPDAPREGIVINLAAMRLFHFSKDQPNQVWSYAVGIGRANWHTPLGHTRIIEKKINPNWVVPASVRREHARKGDPLPKVVPPGPDNPLGRYALRLGWHSYLIHGTNKPYGVGLQVSHGCIRLYPEDIAELFSQVEVGTPVTIVNQPYLAGWRDGQLFVQIYKPLNQNKVVLRKLWRRLSRQLKRYEVQTGQKIDWQKVDRAIAAARGIPLPVLQTSSWDSYLSQTAHVPHPQVWPMKYRPAPAQLGWYVELKMPLSETTAQKLVAILHHQGPPMPAYRFGNRVVVGPYTHKRQAKRIQIRLARDMELSSRLISPMHSQQFVRTLTATQ